VWDNAVVNGTPFTPLATTTYSVTGTDVNGCTNIDSMIVTVNPLPPVFAGDDVEICLGQSVNLDGMGAMTYLWSPVTGLVDPTDPNTICTPTVTTTYTLTGTIFNCSNTASVVVTVNSVPIVSISNDTTICSGSAITLSSGGASSYVWSSGQNNSSITVSPTANTTYTVTATNFNCSDTASVNVVVNPIPNVTATGDTTICEGNSVSLTASGALTYIWSDGFAGALNTVSPVATTTYTVEGSDLIGCTNTASIIVTVNQNPNVSISSLDSVCIAGNDIVLTGLPTGGIFSGTGVSGNYFSPAGLNTDTIISVYYSYTDQSSGCTNNISKIITVVTFPSIVSIITNQYTTVIINLLPLAYPIKMVIIKTGGIQHEYFATQQNNIQAIFEDVDVDNGDLLMIEPVSATLSGCFIYQTYVGINKIKGEDLIKFYPNPFNQVLNVTIPEGNYEVSIIDMLGRNVRSMSVTGDFKIQRDDLVEGLYLLQIISEGKIVFTDKVKVQN